MADTLPLGADELKKECDGPNNVFAANSYILSDEV
jgi:hypothetical protein